jgi:hypothetical protein
MLALPDLVRCGASVVTARDANLQLPRGSDGAVVMIAYVVSEQDPDRAVNIVKSEIAQLTEEVVAVGPLKSRLTPRQRQ